MARRRGPQLPLERGSHYNTKIAWEPAFDVTQKPRLRADPARMYLTPPPRSCNTAAAARRIGHALLVRGAGWCTRLDKTQTQKVMGAYAWFSVQDKPLVDLMIPVLCRHLPGMGSYELVQALQVAQRLTITDERLAADAVERLLALEPRREHDVLAAAAVQAAHRKYSKSLGEAVLSIVLGGGAGPTLRGGKLVVLLWYLYRAVGREAAVRVATRFETTLESVVQQYTATSASPAAMGPSYACSFLHLCGMMGHRVEWVREALAALAVRDTARLTVNMILNLCAAAASVRPAPRAFSRAVGPVLGFELEQAAQSLPSPHGGADGPPPLEHATLPFTKISVSIRLIAAVASDDLAAAVLPGLVAYIARAPLYEVKRRDTPMKHTARTFTPEQLAGLPGVLVHLIKHGTGWGLRGFDRRGSVDTKRAAPGNQVGVAIAAVDYTPMVTRVIEHVVHFGDVAAPDLARLVRDAAALRPVAPDALRKAFAAFDAAAVQALCAEGVADVLDAIALLVDTPNGAACAQVFTDVTRRCVRRLTEVSTRARVEMLLAASMPATPTPPQTEALGILEGGGHAAAEREPQSPLDLALLLRVLLVDLELGRHGGVVPATGAVRPPAGPILADAPWVATMVDDAIVSGGLEALNVNQMTAVLTYLTIHKKIDKAAADAVARACRQLVRSEADQFFSGASDFPIGPFCGLLAQATRAKVEDNALARSVLDSVAAVAEAKARRSATWHGTTIPVAARLVRALWRCRVVDPKAMDTIDAMCRTAAVGVLTDYEPLFNYASKARSVPSEWLWVSATHALEQSRRVATSACRMLHIVALMSRPGRRHVPALLPQPMPAVVWRLVAAAEAWLEKHADEVDLSSLDLACYASSVLPGPKPFLVAVAARLARCSKSEMLDLEPRQRLSFLIALGGVTGRSVALPREAANSLALASLPGLRTVSYTLARRVVSAAATLRADSQTFWDRASGLVETRPRAA
eukprot:TRINITY_DN3764_c0_g1_i1.p1 TRINITY_DN3764_c0_g1~~TRINITY_DN3764_c0_g1_i1.p1  ORF type:complete len:1007 (+),score=146.01 TRINITY_DN3764_c0_g1_i1:89-3022(+)